MAIAIAVGSNAASSKRTGLIPADPKRPRKIEKPAGFGALAMTVKPPPATAPATSAYLNPGVTSGTNEPRYVSAALSVNAVSAVAPRNRLVSVRPAINGLSHQL